MANQKTDILMVKGGITSILYEFFVDKRVAIYFIVSAKFFCDLAFEKDIKLINDPSLRNAYV